MEILRMSVEPELMIEQGRKLFAGEWRFFWAHAIGDRRRWPA